MTQSVGEVLVFSNEYANIRKKNKTLTLRPNKIECRNKLRFNLFLPFTTAQLNSPE
mgnify:CR=1 FL=1